VKDAYFEQGMGHQMARYKKKRRGVHKKWKRGGMTKTNRKVNGEKGGQENNQ